MTTPDFLDELPTEDAGDSGLPPSAQDTAPEGVPDVAEETAPMTPELAGDILNEAPEEPAKAPEEKPPEEADATPEAPPAAATDEIEDDTEPAGTVGDPGALGELGTPGSPPEPILPPVSGMEIAAGDLVDVPKLPPEPPAAADAAPAPRALGFSEKVTIEVARLWDVMMAELSQATRNSIWEMGISDMQKLLMTPKIDLTKPKGRLVPGQTAEVEGWLIAKAGLRLHVQRQTAKGGGPLPPVPALVTGKNVASRSITQDMVAQRRARLKSMRSDSTRK